MLKDDEPPKETAEEKAKRKWRNNALSKEYKERDEKRIRLIDKKPALAPEIAEVLEHDGRRDGSLTRFQKRFIRELGAMFREEHDRNLKMYLVYLDYQKRRLLLEKLRRLEARQAAQQEASKPKRDLFGGG
jgi:hypothetical protein